MSVRASHSSPGGGSTSRRALVVLRTRRWRTSHRGRPSPTAPCGQPRGSRGPDGWRARRSTRRSSSVRTRPGTPPAERTVTGPHQPDDDVVRPRSERVGDRCRRGRPVLAGGSVTIGRAASARISPTSATSSTVTPIGASSISSPNASSTHRSAWPTSRAPPCGVVHRRAAGAHVRRPRRGHGPAPGGR